jgi:D-glycero-D-manno-heptose 1,7-bisphosphate phosphatase
MEELKFTVAPALCLDLDGTVRRSKSGQTFIQAPDDVELMPNIEELIWKYRDAGWFIFGITNQAGVAHGIKTAKDVNDELDATLALFKKDPFHGVKCAMMDGKGKVEPYNHRSLLRKPNIGMLALIEMEMLELTYIMDWDNSLFVGDRPEDEQCAKNAGIPFRHIDSFLKDPHEIKNALVNEEK